MEINIHQLFASYEEGCLQLGGWLEMLKFKDWPPLNYFQECLPRHEIEFLASLPFHEFIDPRDGLFNLGIMLPKVAIKPNLGLKTYITYGLKEEFYKGDSMTKLHCDMFDAVRCLLSKFISLQRFFWQENIDPFGTIPSLCCCYPKNLTCLYAKTCLLQQFPNLIEVGMYQMNVLTRTL